MNEMVIYFSVIAVVFVPLCLIVGARKRDRYFERRRDHLARLPVAPSAKWALKVNSKN